MGLRFILIVVLVLVIAKVDGKESLPCVKIYMSGNDCVKCNNNVQKIISILNRTTLRKEYYTDIPNQKIYDEVFLDVGLDRKLFKKTKKIERSYLSIVGGVQSDQVYFLPLYLFDEVVFENVIKQFDIHHTENAIFNWKLTSSLLPKKSLVISGNYAYTLNYSNNLLFAYALSNQSLQRVGGEIDFIKKNIDIQVDEVKNIGEFNFIGLSQVDSIRFMAYCWFVYNDSLSTHACLTFKNSAVSDMGVELINCELLPHKVDCLKGVDIYANYRAGLIRNNENVIVQVYVPTGDISLKNKATVDSSGFTYPLFGLRKNAGPLVYYQNRIPDEALFNNTFYFNLSYQMVQHDTESYAIERSQPYLVKMGDTSRYYFSDTKPTKNPYAFGAKNTIKNLYAAQIQDRIILCSYENGKYYVTVFSPALKNIVFRKRLELSNPVFSSDGKQIYILDVKGMQLKDASLKSIAF